MSDIPSNGRPKVLIADDESHIRMLFKSMLMKENYQVVGEAADGNEALDLFKKDPYRYDLIITDLTMPYLTGDRLAEEITALRPEVPVILATGYANTADGENLKVSGIKAFIPKPCQRKELAKTLRLILDSNPS